MPTSSIPDEPRLEVEETQLQQDEDLCLYRAPELSQQLSWQKLSLQPYELQRVKYTGSHWEVAISCKDFNKHLYPVINEK